MCIVCLLHSEGLNCGSVIVMMMKSGVCVCVVITLSVCGIDGVVAAAL